MTAMRDAAGHDVLLLEYRLLVGDKAFDDPVSWVLPSRMLPSSCVMVGRDEWPGDITGMLRVNPGDAEHSFKRHNVADLDDVPEFAALVARIDKTKRILDKHATYPRTFHAAGAAYMQMNRGKADAFDAAVWRLLADYEAGRLDVPGLDAARQAAHP